MFQFLSEVASIIGFTIESTGVLIIVAGFFYSFWAAMRYRSQKSPEELLREFRHNVGQTMLLGLDFLVAGDIIRTVTVVHSLMGVASLGLIVLVRTLLVFTIHVEVEGQWPWKSKALEQTKPTSET
ncbi:MAG: DUF1622 domain-containing protein [Deltaproteobacteria bacterium]|nr:DUF1622 domain-containing protein [Deltaproteobacteria bacterium]